MTGQLGVTQVGCLGDQLRVDGWSIQGIYECPPPPITPRISCLLCAAHPPFSPGPARPVLPDTRVISAATPLLALPFAFQLLAKLCRNPIHGKF